MSKTICFTDSQEPKVTSLASTPKATAAESKVPASSGNYQQCAGLCTGVPLPAPIHLFQALP